MAYEKSRRVHSKFKQNKFRFLALRSEHPYTKPQSPSNELCSVLSKYTNQMAYLKLVLLLFQIFSDTQPQRCATNI
jgi:hypothetical protein